jgi:nucleoside-diphosphate-sugar epimerase
LSSRTALVTGATGLLGSHIAEQLIQQGHTVRALVRPNARTDFLRSLGVSLIEGNLEDKTACKKAVADVDWVFHSAAKVGDWGRWAEFETDCLDATRNIAQASRQVGVERFVQISSTSAYGHPRDGGPPVEETAPLGQNVWAVWDYYTLSKVECERILWRMAEENGLRLTVIRPSWLYGERDRTTMPRIIERLRRRGIPTIGRGDNPLSAVYAGTVAEAAIRAAQSDRGLGEAFNITHQGPITQRAYFELLAELCGGKKSRLRLPHRLVFAAAFGLEAWGRLLRRSHPPLITRYATWLMGRHLSYSTQKAETALGWQPGISYRDSLERTVAWYFRQARPTG